MMFEDALTDDAKLLDVLPEIATAADMVVEAVVQRPEQDPRPDLPGSR